MKEAGIRIRWRPDQPEEESWELECKLAAPIGKTATITVTGGSSVSCVVSLQREVVRLALGQKFLDQEFAP